MRCENTFFHIDNVSFYPNYTSAFLCIYFSIIAFTKRKNMNKVKISKKRHLTKAITWNLLAMTITFFILSHLPPYFGFEPIDKSSVGWLVVLDRVVKLIFYYFHERTWFTSNWGVVKPKN
jgi:hypothetical protein